MRKMIVYCDRCGQQTEKVYHLTATQEKIPEGDETAAPGMSTLHDIDLCWDCLTRTLQYAIDTGVQINADKSDQADHEGSGADE